MSKELIEQLAKKIQALPRYSFLLNESGGVKRWANDSGDWIDRYEVVTMIDNAIEAYQAAAPIDNVAEALEVASKRVERFMLTNAGHTLTDIQNCINGALIPDTQANKKGE
jgi:hypothetical protein